MQLIGRKYGISSGYPRNIGGIGTKDEGGRKYEVQGTKYDGEGVMAGFRGRIAGFG